MDILSRSTDLEASAMGQPFPLEEFLFAVRGDCEGDLVVSARQDGQWVSMVFRDDGEAAEWLRGRSAAGDDCYFGVATRSGVEAWPTRDGLLLRRGGLEDCFEAQAIVVDLDIVGPAHKAPDGFRDWDHVEEFCARIPYDVTLVDSGHGAHLYLLLKEPVPATELDALMPSIKATFERIGSEVGGRPEGMGVERVFRVPGTSNHKGEPIEVSVRRDNLDARYDLSEIEEWADPVPTLPTWCEGAVGSSGVDGVTLGDGSSSSYLVGSYWAMCEEHLHAQSMEWLYEELGGRELGPEHGQSGRRRARCVNSRHNDGAAEGEPPESCVIFTEERSFACLGASCGASGGDLVMVSYLLGFEGRIDGEFNRKVLEAYGKRVGLDPAGCVHEDDLALDGVHDFEGFFADSSGGVEVDPAVRPPQSAAPLSLPGLTPSGEQVVAVAQPSGDGSGVRSPLDEQLRRVDTTALLKLPPPLPDWLIEPLIPTARITALVAEAKAGKSLLALEAAVCFAIGRAFLRTPAGPGRRVLYLDFEMGEGDLLERLLEFDLTDAEIDRLDKNLIYLAFPPFRELDQKSEGHKLVQIALHYRVELVVIDTMSRVITDENSNSDVQALFRWTLAPLKAEGIASFRLDHVGHANTGRARGGSAKVEDVDVAWTMSATESGVRLQRTHQRVSWVPETITLKRRGPGGNGPLHEMVGGSSLGGYPPGTRKVIDWLNAHDVPVSLTDRKVRSEYLKDESINPPGDDQLRTGNEVLRSAQRYRSMEAKRADQESDLDRFEAEQASVAEALIQEAFPGGVADV